MRDVDGEVWVLSVTLLIMVGAAVLLVLAPRDDSDDSDAPDGRRSGFKILTDSLTGCQYLSHRGDTLVPRYDGRGGIVGCKP